MPTKRLMDSDRKIARLPIQPKKIWYPVEDGSSLYLVHHKQSKRFVWKTQFPPKSKKYIDVPLGVWDNNRSETLKTLQELKRWKQANPTSHPDQFFNPPSNEKTLEDAFKRYASYLKSKNKERTWRDRLNKMNQMEAYFGKDIPLSEFEDRAGQRKVIAMLESLFISKKRYYHAKRCRGLLKQIFAYCIKMQWMETNPALIKHPDEDLHEERGNVHIEWENVEDFLSKVSSKSCDFSVANLAVKAYLMMGIRVGALVRLEWDWFNEEKDMWEIPAQTTGLKNLKKNKGKEFNHIIPSTPELKLLMSKIREITGWQKYVFFGEKQTHIHEETINKFIRRIEPNQSAHGWRDVFTEGCLENNFSWDIVQRCLGHREHKQGTRGHYDNSLLLDQRRELMEFWTSTLVEKGLAI